MKEAIRQFSPETEFYLDEGCYIVELSNSKDDPDVSISRARVKPGVTTHWHRLSKTTERYVILEGRGLAEIGSLPPQKVNPGDIVIIPPMCPQRITNIGADDLIFLAVCTPRFLDSVYAEIEFSSAHVPTLSEWGSSNDEKAYKDL